MKKYNIFVYGTLKTGHGNNRLLNGQTLLGVFDTTPDYTLLAAGIPFMTKGNHKVRGELWEVDIEARTRMDWLEGHPSFYKRTPISLENDDYKAVEAYMIETNRAGYGSSELPADDNNVVEWVGRHG